MAAALDTLRRHVTGAIERGESVAIVGIPALPTAQQLASEFSKELRGILAVPVFEFDMQDEAHCALWSEAWSIAKASGFEVQS